MGEFHYPYAFPQLKVGFRASEDQCLDQLQSAEPSSFGAGEREHHLGMTGGVGLLLGGENMLNVAVTDGITRQAKPGSTLWGSW